MELNNSNMISRVSMGRNNTCVSNEDKNTGKRIDIYKDTPVRYLGFTNEVGAAASHIFTGSKGLIGKLPTLSWIPAIGYIALDVTDKFKKGEDGTGKKPSFRAGGSELCAQLLQSVALPTLIIKGTQTAAKKVCDKFAKNPTFKSEGKWGKVITTAASFAMLFATIKPIDKVAEHIIHNIVNPILGLGHKNTAVVDIMSEKEDLTENNKVEIKTKLDEENQDDDTIVIIKDPECKDTE